METIKTTKIITPSLNISLLYHMIILAPTA